MNNTTLVAFQLWNKRWSFRSFIADCSFPNSSLFPNTKYPFHQLRKTQPQPFSYSVIQTRLNMEQLNDLMINPEIREASTDKSRDNPRKSFWKSLMVDIAASLSLFSNKIRRQFLSSAPVMYIVKQNYEPSWNVFTCLYRNMICRRILRIVNL